MNTRTATISLLLVLLAATSAAAQPAADPDDGLLADEHTVALYKFNEADPDTSYDSSGNGNHALNDGTTVLTGRFGNARQFDGVDDRINIDLARQALQGTTAWTIEYVARSEGGSQVPELVNHVCRGGWWLGPRSSTIRFSIKTTTGGSCGWTVGEAFAEAEMDTDWHYYALTWDADSLRVYRDGELRDSAPAGGTFQGTQSQRAWIGHNDSGSGSYTAGLADDLRVSDVARSAEELLATATELGFADPPAACDGLAVTTTADDGPGSLRQAITDANADPDTDTICFAIDGEGPHTIAPASQLPEITQPVVIDGYTQPGASPNTLAVGSDAVLMIELDGSSAGEDADGLHLAAGGSTVRGLAIGNFDGEHIYITGAGNNVIEGNFIGMDVSGTQPKEGGDGIWIDRAPDNQIGGMTPATRNIIAGNINSGMFITGEGANDNRVLNNYIGTNPAGTEAVGSNGGGMFIWGADDTVIGAPDAGNVIAGSDGGRLFVLIGETSPTERTIIQGNYIGTNATGDAALGDTGGGLFIYGAPNTLIGGTGEGEGNLISGNDGGDIYIGSDNLMEEVVGSDGTVIQGNLIGTDASGTSVLRDICCGLTVGSSSDILIGGTAPGARNIVSGYTSYNIDVSYGGDGTGATIQGNYVGLDITGAQPLGSTNAYGLRVESNSVVGGTEPGAGNVIANIGTDGGRFNIGLWIDGDNIIVQGNFIGTDATGTQPMGNGTGIMVEGGSADNLIGGTEPGAGNLIAFNTDQGVVLESSSCCTGTGNAILGNRIYGNGELGIDLGYYDGMTPNDPGDADTGPNNLQNFPEIESADYDEESGQITLTYLVDTDPVNATYPLRIEFFQADDDGQEGAAFLGTDTYTESDWDGCGAAPCQKQVVFTPLAPVTRADHVLATATDDEGNTSEFSMPSQALPVELAAFEAAADGQAVRLTWRTASETNNHGFEVQRAPSDAGVGAIHESPLRWTTLAFVEGAGTTTEARAYRFADHDLPYEAQRLVYRLRQVDGDGTFAYSEEVEVDLSVPQQFVLHGNYPNPFSGQTTIRYELPQDGPVRLVVYDLLGRKVAVLVDEAQEAGRKEVVFGASGLASGVYFVRLQAGAHVLTQRMAVVR